MTNMKEQTNIEKAKTWTLISIFAFGIGTAVGFYINGRLYAKYTKSPVVQVVQAEKPVQESK